MEYAFYGDARMVLWLGKSFKKITEEIFAKVAKRLELLYCSQIQTVSQGGATNFPTGRLTLPTWGLEYGFQGTINA